MTQTQTSDAQTRGEFAAQRRPESSRVEPSLAAVARY